MEPHLLLELPVAQRRRCARRRPGRRHQRQWGSFDAFKTAFQTSAVGNFGSGWTWLVKKADGSVDIVNMGAVGTPLTTSDRALLCVDVWEHADYIDYRNMRPKFRDALIYLASLRVLRGQLRF